MVYSVDYTRKTSNANNTSIQLWLARANISVIKMKYRKKNNEFVLRLFLHSDV